MKKIAGWCLFLLLQYSAPAQLSVDSIRSDDVSAMLQFLSSDSLKGRGNFTPELATAARFIAGRFASAGLSFFPGEDTYFQSFAVAGTKGRKPADSVKNQLQNVVGVLDGKTKKGEAIIFCAHYDHLGTEGRSIFNGANDNASGTTALIALAGYYARRGDNERTLIFCAFAGEELGLLGSQAFVPVIDPAAVVAVVNIEMIGRPQYGQNAFFVTGAQYSSLEKIFRKNLGKTFRIRPEPAADKQLFRRSDNFPFALAGIPAHTIMAGDDDDNCYHQPCDDFKQIDIANMTNLIRGIALGCETLVNGVDTPSRIDPKRIR